MSNPIELTDLCAPELDLFARLTEAQLRNRLEPEKGVFIAESAKVIGTALDAGLTPLALLMERRHLEGQGKAIIERCGELPIYTAPLSVLTELTDAWKISAGDTTVYVNRRADGKIVHRNCINIMDGWFTDAELLVVSGPRRAVVNGSILRRGGESLLETFSRVNGWTDRFPVPGKDA